MIFDSQLDTLAGTVVKRCSHYKLLGVSVGLDVEELKLLGLHVVDCCLIQQWDVKPWNSFPNTTCGQSPLMTEPPKCILLRVPFTMLSIFTRVHWFCHSYFGSSLWMLPVANL